MGALAPEAVAVEVRRAGETDPVRPRLGLVVADGRIVADKPRQSAEEISAYMLASELEAGAGAAAGAGRTAAEVRA